MQGLEVVTLAPGQWTQRTPGLDGRLTQPQPWVPVGERKMRTRLGGAGRTMPRWTQRGVCREKLCLYLPTHVMSFQITLSAGVTCVSLK